MAVKWWNKDSTYGKYDYAAASINKDGTLTVNKHGRELMKNWKQVLIGYDEDEGRVYLKLCERDAAGARSFSGSRINTCKMFHEWHLLLFYTAEGCKLIEQSSGLYYFDLNKKRGPKPKEKE